MRRAPPTRTIGTERAVRRRSTRRPSRKLSGSWRCPQQGTPRPTETTTPPDGQPPELPSTWEGRSTRTFVLRRELKGQGSACWERSLDTPPESAQQYLATLSGRQALHTAGLYISHRYIVLLGLSPEPGRSPLACPRILRAGARDSRVVAPAPSFQCPVHLRSHVWNEELHGIHGGSLTR